MRHWANRYVGERWTKEQDCWYWFRRIQDEVFNIDVPVVATDNTDLKAMIRTFEGHAERGRWSEVGDPLDGYAVLLSNGKHPHHIGVWADDDRLGGVVHALQSAGVVFSMVSNLTLNGWYITGIYRHADHHTQP